ncbi:MAG: hypothetical protein R6X34_13470 [Chloroflexota bacterium]
MEIDNAVAAAYGWHTSTGSTAALDLDHGFHEKAQGIRYTISEPARREVLTRLLQLNHQRHAEEQEHGGKGEGEKEKKAPTKTRAATRKKAPNQDDGQLSLL